MEHKLGLALVVSVLRLFVVSVLQLLGRAAIWVANGTNTEGHLDVAGRALAVAQRRCRGKGGRPVKNAMSSRSARPGLSRAVALALGMVVVAVQAAAQTLPEIARTAFPSVVSLVMHFEPSSRSFEGGTMIRTRIAVGSGFFVREDVVATNAHVVKGAVGGHARRVVGDRTPYDVAGILAIDEEHDLALVRVSGLRAQPLALAEPTQAAVGDEVFAVGSPGGLEGTFSPGIVSGLRAWKSRTLLQITAPISPGSSGGPVLNRRGEVVGVAVGTLSQGQNLNFAVSVGDLRTLLERPPRWTRLITLPREVAIPTTPQAPADMVPAPDKKADGLARVDGAVEARAEFNRHLKALAEQADTLTSLLGPAATREQYLAPFRELEARRQAVRARLVGQPSTPSLEALLRACDRLAEAEGIWNRELAAGETVAGLRRAVDMTRADHARRQSMVSKIEIDIAEENLRNAGRVRDGFTRERLAHWEAATRAVKGPGAEARP
jgi:S1-C subfamily serine protease